MSALSRQYLERVYRELDEVGVAISVVGTRRQKLMELARLVVPISDALIGMRPDVKSVRDDLVRLTHNMRRAQVKQRPASRAVRAVADKVKDVQRLVNLGLGDVPRDFIVGKMTFLNYWGYTKNEIQPFVDVLENVNSVLKKMGLLDEIGDAFVTLDPSRSSQASMTYDLVSDSFFADPLRARARTRGVTDSIGARMWVKLFERKDVDTWGGSQQAWESFSKSFFLLIKGKKLKKIDSAKMTVSLGRIVGPENWRKVA